MFGEATTAIARDLAILVASGDSTPGEDLECALAGHAQLVELLVTIHDDMVGSLAIAQAAARDVGLLDWDPVRLLGRLLRNYPRPDPSVASTDLLRRAAVSEQGRCWQRILRNATVASYSWRGAAAWTVMADCAALAQMLAYVTPKLAVAAHWSGRRMTARVLHRASRAALWQVAARVRATAALGPLPPVEELRHRARWPVRVQRAERPARPRCAQDRSGEDSSPTCHGCGHAGGHRWHGKCGRDCDAPGGSLRHDEPAGAVDVLTSVA